MPVAVSREPLADTLGTLMLRLSVNVSFPSNILSRNTGTVTELLLLPAGNIADLEPEAKSTPATKYYCINHYMLLLTQHTSSRYCCRLTRAHIYPY